jgi:hypothetical protein
MAVPVTLVESNPVTTIFNSQLVDFASVTSNTIAGPTLYLGRGDDSTFGRQVTFVFMTGATVPGNVEFDDTLDIRLQGLREGTSDFADMDGIMQKVLVGSGSSENPAENTATIMYMDSNMLEKMGEASTAGDHKNVPFVAVRYRITATSGGAAGRELPLCIMAIAGDLRYGLFGTNAQLASQMKGKSYDLGPDYDTPSLISASTTVYR